MQRLGGEKGRLQTQPTVSRILAAKKQRETKQSRKKISTFTLEENILKENYQHNQKVKKQFSKNMMEVQLWEGRLDGASKNKCEKKRHAMPIHLWQEQSMFRWLKIRVGFLWWNSKWWGIHIRWPQFSRISKQMTLSDRVRFEKNAGMLAVISTIVFF